MSAIASASTPPGARCAAAQRRNAARAGRATEDLHRLHRDEDQREAPPEVECTRVRADRLDGQPAGPRAQRVEQRLLGVERDDLVTAPGEVERDAPGSGADVEHRAADDVGERPPGVEVRVVGAALEVVPDDVVRAAHANDPSAAPRATSSSRSASIAV